MAGTLVKYHQKWPSPHDLPKTSVLIFDERFKNLAWVKKFPHRYSVKSGEKLKDLRQFPKHIEKILKISEKTESSRFTFIALGGGSVGDFAGFVASVFKRGSDLIHIPSTWLSSIDSAHGGKTGLNVQSSKNQIGTFYPANEVWLIKPLLESQPLDRTSEALGEILKMALIHGKGLWNKVSKVDRLEELKPWTLLKDLIEAKLSVVKSDPKETKGLRSVLNLGHTVGHVFEAELKTAHGTAVLWGLGFALQWSLHRKVIDQKQMAEILSSPLGFLIPTSSELRKNLKKLKRAKKYLLQDKKKSGKNSLKFIFVHKIGQTRIESVFVDDILNEIKRQSQ